MRFFPTLNCRKARLLQFHLNCVASAPEEQADRIREAVHLFALEERLSPPLLPGEEPVCAALEAMLACGAHESAVLALIGEGYGYMLSRGANGCCLASLFAADEEEETVAEGATPALALLAAFAGVLLAGEEGFSPADATFPSMQGSRLN